MNLMIGDVLFNEVGKKYTLIQPVGHGGFGIVYEVQDSDGTKFAVKTIITALDDGQFRALVNEGDLATQIIHANVLRVFFFHDGQKYPTLPPYMLLEFADGGHLGEVINQRRSESRYFTNQELKTLFHALASGMKAINEKLVHRDIKPDNILFVNGIPKISDFGLSKVVGAATRSQSFKGINHIMYCAPEAWRAEKNTFTMDMYSMGLVFFELATLQYPYHVETTGDIIEAFKNAHLTKIITDPQVLNPSLELNLRQIILKMTAKRPEERYPSWDEIIDRLDSSDIAPANTNGVARLVEKALEVHRRNEQARLLVEEKQKRDVELKEIVNYCFEEITQQVKNIVSEFNNTSEFTKLSTHFYSETMNSNAETLNFEVRKNDRTENTIYIKIICLFDEYYLDTHKIKAWGTVKTSSGRGFNILLVETELNDIYGKWKTFHVRHSGFARGQDTRLEPFPFELRELPKEIFNVRSMHIYNAEQNDFKPEFFHPLLEEILE
jgi:serine/threonine protein kinase